MSPSTEILRSSRYRGALLGLACGDAVGTTVEFMPRGSFARMTEMVGGGPFGLAAGQWTDDTSMALCLASSLADLGRFDPEDQMRRYVKWWRQGYWSSTGCCFDIGNTVASALRRFEATGNQFSGSEAPAAAGNGCIMRLAPVVLFCFPDEEAAVRMAADSSRTTHGSVECLEACRLMAVILCRALAGQAKEAVLAPAPHLELSSSRIAGLAAGSYREKPESLIRGTGYVVDSLEAALWCFHHTGCFRDAVLLAANLGDDADTTAAIVGQIAGAYFGVEDIPDAWRNKIALGAEITALADRLNQNQFASE